MCVCIDEYIYIYIYIYIYTRIREMRIFIQMLHVQSTRTRSTELSTKCGSRKWPPERRPLLCAAVGVRGDWTERAWLTERPEETGQEVSRQPDSWANG